MSDFGLFGYVACCAAPLDTVQRWEQPSTTGGTISTQNLATPFPPIYIRSEPGRPRPRLRIRLLGHAYCARIVAFWRVATRPGAALS